MKKTNYSQEAKNRVYGKRGANLPTVSHQNATLDSNIYFNLKVPDNQKTEEWYRSYVDYIVPPSSTTVDDFDSMKQLYEIYNDDIQSFKELFKEFCDPLGENMGNIDDEIQPYPVLHNKVNVLKGEYLGRSDNYNIVLLSADAIRSKNEKYVQSIMNRIDQELAVEMQRIMMNLEGMSDEEIEQYIEERKKELSPKDLEIKDFKVDTEIFYEKAIKYAHYTQKIPTLKLECLEDAIIADRFFVYSGWKFGKPFLEIRNPLFTGFQKSPNERYVHKSDYVWYKKPITITDALTEYGHLLSDDDLMRLGFQRTTNSVDKRHSLVTQDNSYVRSNLDTDLYMSINNNISNESKLIGTSQTQGLHRNSEDSFLIWETHIEFKGFRNIIFISYTDDYGNEITMPTSREFKIPKEATKNKVTNRWGVETTNYTWIEFDREYTAEEIWIPWKYEVVRLGEDVYPVQRAVPYQYPNIENPYSSFTLSTFGRVLTDKNAKSISLLKRAVPSYLQYLFIKKIQNRELAKYQGFIQDIDVDTIPTALGEDINGELIKDPIAVWLIYRKKLGLNIYSGSQTTNGLPPPATRSPGSGSHIIGTAADIFNLQQLLDLISREIGLSMGIPPQREAQFQQNSNVGDNRQALQQSYYITEPYFYMIDDVWRDILYDYVNNFRVYCKNLKHRTNSSPMFHYVLPDGTQELLEVTDDMLNTIDVGIFLDSNVNQQKYNDYMLNQVQAFAQNAGEGVEMVSTIIKAITNGSSAEETHKLIQLAAKQQQDTIAAQQEQQAKQQEQILTKQQELEQMKHEQELAKIELKETLSGEYLLKNTELQLLGKAETQASANDIKLTTEAMKAASKPTTPKK